MFEQASRIKLRFDETAMKNVTAEDLWDFPITSPQGLNLNDLMEELCLLIKDNNTDKILRLKFNIVKYIIDYKLNKNKKKINK